MTTQPSKPNSRERRMLRQLARAALPFLFAAGAVHAHGPHVHGAAELDVAHDGHALTFFLRAPGASLLGFERAPKTDAERALLARLRRDLQEPVSLLAPTSAANCVAAPARAQFDGFDSTGGHADIEAEIVFTCAAPEKLTGFSVPAFARYPALKSLKHKRVASPLPYHCRCHARQPCADRHRRRCQRYSECHDFRRHGRHRKLCPCQHQFCSICIARPRL